MKAEDLKADLIDSIQKAADRMGEYEFAFTFDMYPHYLETLRIGQLRVIAKVLLEEGWMEAVAVSDWKIEFIENGRGY